MMNIVFMLDIGILILLAFTVFLAFRLNTNLRHFRESRFEMEGLVNRLTANVERAEKAIAGLQVTARHSGADIDKKIKESKFLSDELKFMNEAGESLANRLEKLAQTNKEILEKIEIFGGVGPNSSPMNSDIVVKDQSKSKSPMDSFKDNAPQSNSMPSFFIKDRDHDDKNGYTPAESFDDLDFEFENNLTVSNLQSQAEREFFEVIKKRKMGTGQN